MLHLIRLQIDSKVACRGLDLNGVVKSVAIVKRIRYRVTILDDLEIALQLVPLLLIVI